MSRNNQSPTIINQKNPNKTTVTTMSSLSISYAFQRDFLKGFMQHFTTSTSKTSIKHKILWSAYSHYASKSGNWDLLNYLSRSNNFQESIMETIYPRTMYEIGGTYEYHLNMMRQMVETYKTINNEVKAMMKTRSIDRLLKDNAFHFDKKSHIESTLCNMIQSCYDDPNVRYSGGKRSANLQDIYKFAEIHEPTQNITSNSPFYFCAFDSEKMPNNIVDRYWDSVLTQIHLTKSSNMRSIEVIYNPHAQYELPEPCDESCDNILYMSLIEEIYHYLVAMETDYWFKENINNWIHSVSK